MRLRPWAPPLVGVAGPLVLGLVLGTCASSGPGSGPQSGGRPAAGPRAPEASGAGGEEIERRVHVDRATPAPTPVLAGPRCRPDTGTCRCRTRGDDAESEPPPEGYKRFEIRMSADGGQATLASPAFGTLTTTGAREACFYFDAPAGTTHEVTFTSRPERREAGVTPRLAIAEYGPAGPYWYDVISVACVGADGRCTKAGATAWADRVRQQRRGRQDPCGSVVVSGLGWETSGAEDRRDGGYLHDFSVAFRFDVKRFAPQLPPNSPECVPK